MISTSQCCSPAANSPTGFLDPRIQYWALRGGLLPQTYKLEFVFPTGVVGESGQPQLVTPMSQDFWVHRLTSIIELPGFALGNIQESQYEFYRGLTANIDVQLQVLGGGIANQYLINDSLTPLSLVAPPPTQASGGKEYYNWVLQFSQTLRCMMVLRRSYEGQVPLRVVIMLEGFTLACAQFQGMSRDKCAKLLADLTANPTYRLGSIPGGDEPAARPMGLLGE